MTAVRTVFMQSNMQGIGMTAVKTVFMQSNMQGIGMIAVRTVFMQVLTSSFLLRGNSPSTAA